MKPRPVAGFHCFWDDGEYILEMTDRYLIKLLAFQLLK